MMRTVTIPLDETDVEPAEATVDDLVRILSRIAETPPIAQDNETGCWCHHCGAESEYVEVGPEAWRMDYVTKHHVGCPWVDARRVFGLPLGRGQVQLIAEPADNLYEINWNLRSMQGLCPLGDPPPCPPLVESATVKS